MSLPDFSLSSVMVLGDVMLDIYYSGNVDRISPEAPVPVVRVNQTHYTLGGAANVSHNISNLKTRTVLIGTAGKDGHRKILDQLLDDAGIKKELLDSDKPTTTKIRVIGGRQQIARLDFEECRNPDEYHTRRIMDLFRKNVVSSQVLILSDYGKGICSDEICRMVIRECKKNKVQVLIDPKGSDWSKYSGADAVTPNVKELGEAFGKTVPNENEAIEKAGREIREKYDLKFLLVTRSEKGMTCIFENECVHIPTEAREVFDVSGAGDTVIAALAAGLSSGLSVIDSVQLANRAAGIVVGKLGTVPITLEELTLSYFDERENRKIVEREEIEKKISELKKHGKKIVFTNGCFDIIHRGHISYLRKARNLGDVLIVGLNSDASVKRLKGESRPVNSEADRAEMLSALEFIDLVTIFTEDTPFELIKTVKPDILVKGGDYSADSVVGREFSGKTVILPFVDGYSTTKIIEKMKG